jgi:two-component sensor histidine kinase
VKNRTGPIPVEGLADALAAVVRAGTKGDALGLPKPEGRVLPPRRDELEWQSRRILESLPVPIYTTDAEGWLTFYNQAAAEFAGRQPHLHIDQWCVTWRLYLPDGTFLPHDHCPVAIGLKESRPIRGVTAIAERPDGARLPFMPYPTPLYDASGHLSGAVNMLVDLSFLERMGSEAGEHQRPGLGTGSCNPFAPGNSVLQHILGIAAGEAASPVARAELRALCQRIDTILAAQTAVDRFDDTRCDASSLVAAVCASAEHWWGERIAVTRRLAPRLIANHTALPLALILNALIENMARRYARCGCKGTIEVELTDFFGALELRVEDLGPCLRHGGSQRFMSGLGTVMGLVKQIGGFFDVESAAGCIVRLFDAELADMMV